MKAAVSVFLLLVRSVLGHDQHHFGDSQETWLSKYGKQVDQPFSGPLAFSHLTYARCLEDESVDFDIAVLGIPFDTGTSYRPGARFGPYGIRSGSRRQRDIHAYTLAWGNNPYEQGFKIIDCGDVPVSPFDNALAINQMEVAYSSLLARSISSKVPAWKEGAVLAKDGREHPRIVSMGGDHTIVLPILRALYKIYGPIAVIHFDAHLDTWTGHPGAVTEQSRFNHGTFFYKASQEGLISNSSIHAGIRCKLLGLDDVENDKSVGFHFITSDDIDDHGVPAIIGRIRERVGDNPVYLRLDFFTVLSPERQAVVAGTPEAGGWTSREVKRIIRGLAGLNFVGADVVEVAPAYDHAEVTGTTAADIVHDLLSLLVSPVPSNKPDQPEIWSRYEL
ncbi:arginase family-domain-containing protein [Pisolithus thermaeus]|nr:arginase family-domain-containing protein [Pisolithus thermaeus]